MKVRVKFSGIVTDELCLDGKEVKSVSEIKDGTYYLISPSWRGGNHIVLYRSDNSLFSTEVVYDNELGVFVSAPKLTSMSMKLKEVYEYMRDNSDRLGDEGYYDYSECLLRNINDAGEYLERECISKLAYTIGVSLLDR